MKDSRLLLKEKIYNDVSHIEPRIVRLTEKQKAQVIHAAFDAVCTLAAMREYKAAKVLLESLRGKMNDVQNNKDKYFRRNRKQF
ncbi:hypothetical protein [Hyphococcus sp.]|uniref:hypothetical protein n=1 Tax=Hyphococcus sp. TaxID=2038636 RepID=UPI003CCC2F79